MYRLVDGGATTKLFISKRDAACVWTMYLFVLFLFCFAFLSLSLLLLLLLFWFLFVFLFSFFSLLPLDKKMTLGGMGPTEPV